MKVKLLEHYQDARNSFAPEQEVDVSYELGAWLVEHRKAIRLEVAPPAPMEPRHLDVEPQFEQAEEPPQPKPRKRGKH